MTLNLSRRTLIALAGFTALSCAASSTAIAQEKKTIALVQINQQALFFNQMNQGAQKAADAAGVKLVIVKRFTKPLYNGESACDQEDDAQSERCCRRSWRVGYDSIAPGQWQS
ncbi:hypothetical protein AN640_02200 [Candidatus Epulonipiscium fishelsonii]|uniref:Uncharacterized protein n=1 Tax=Candidatus Epulonipiscium fishelsonii TaxID=77094 RepID=A0ACC8X9G6_9FIRM|nr:hypothetical protein AN640_02200 [Epulopiscium sp. SCG-D08WGA-EpuloA1]